MPNPPRCMAQKVKAKMPAEGQQACLDLWPREHDLPPRWDGLPVEWGDWSDTTNVIISPPRAAPTDAITAASPSPA